MQTITDPLTEDLSLKALLPIPLTPTEGTLVLFPYSGQASNEDRDIDAQCKYPSG